MSSEILGKHSPKFLAIGLVFCHSSFTRVVYLARHKLVVFVWSDWREQPKRFPSPFGIRSGRMDRACVCLRNLCPWKGLHAGKR